MSENEKPLSWDYNTYAINVGWGHEKKRGNNDIVIPMGICSIKYASGGSFELIFEY
jgi:hypothetical protein